ncbi:hypothetical protein AAG906_020570 [Vitis piasezkii]
MWLKEGGFKDLTGHHSIVWQAGCYGGNILETQIPCFMAQGDRMAKRANFISSLQPYSDPLVHCRGIESEISKQICYSDKESLDKFSIEESLDRSYSSILIASWNKIQVFLSSDPVEERDDNKVSWKLEPQL